jgi:antitoxin (DNA-binding transcriptional repressor) of toxin-antitoxin stability system
MTGSIESAPAHWRELIDRLHPNEQLIIVDDGQPLATLIRAPRTSWPCKAGSARDTPHWMAPDFDATDLTRRLGAPVEQGARTGARMPHR